VVLKEVQGEISIIREKLDSGLSNIGSQSGDTTSKVKELQDSIDDITEKGGFQILDLIITELKSHMTC
jgi:hypothetical protein